MAGGQDDNIRMQPRCEFDFNLPHGIDTQTDGHNKEQCLDSAIHRNDQQKFGDVHTKQDSVEDIVHTTGTHSDPELHDQNDSDQHMDYGTLEKNFPDDEYQTAVFDHSWEGHQVRDPSAESKESPSYLEEGRDDEIGLGTKTTPMSLFGGIATEHREPRFEEHHLDPGDYADLPRAPEEGIYYSMSSDFDERERESSPSERPFNLDFGLDSSNGEKMSPRASLAPSEESIIIPPDDQPVYELRQNIERKKAFTYIDTDKSGNFDPSEEAKQRMLRLHKAKAAKAAKAAAQQKKGKGKARPPKEHIMKCIVKLHFDAFGNVRNCTDDEDNWPGGWSEIDSDCEREIQEHREYYRRNTPGREEQMVIEDPGGDVDDLTGYPVARGCKRCRKHEQDCSMVGGGMYPCVACVAEGCECEPIIPPTIKGHCKQCVEDGKNCSFEYDPEQAICDHCTEGEFICDALPPNGYKAERIDIYQIIGGPDRQYAQCTVCRSEKKRCSLKRKTDKPPCKYCKKHGLGCTFFDLPERTNIAKKKGGRAAKGPTDGDAPEVAMPGSDYFTAEDLADMQLMDDDVISREPTPELDMEDAEGHKGALIKIQTSFAHPIKFNTIEQVSPDCNFCELPTFGFTGFYEKTVHVLKWGDGLGFSEIAAGHREDGNGATTMCQECVMDRVQIICCSTHELRQLYDADLDFDAAAHDLMLAEPRSPEMRYQLQRWCSMCFSLAEYRCCAQSETVMDDPDGKDAAMAGCGLRLCSTCELNLNRQYSGDVNAMATSYNKLPKMAADTPDGTWMARADVGLLTMEGLLMANVERDAQKGED
ncbi:Nn.00g091610.m01.CDS01 [Neocucurbitaria sp. VM-36]